MMNYLKKILFIFIIFATSSCYLLYDQMPESWNWGIKPRPLRGVRNFPSLDTEYGKGFRDGCQSGWDEVGTGLVGDFQARYDFRRAQKSVDYDTGWWDGQEQCTYILDWNIY